MAAVHPPFGLVACLARAIGRVRLETGGAAKRGDFPYERLQRCSAGAAFYLPEEAAMGGDHAAGARIDQQHVIIMAHPALVPARAG